MKNRNIGFTVWPDKRIFEEEKELLKSVLKEEEKLICYLGGGFVSNAYLIKNKKESFYQVIKHYPHFSKLKPKTQIQEEFVKKYDNYSIALNELNCSHIFNHANLIKLFCIREKDNDVFTISQSLSYELPRKPFSFWNSNIDFVWNLREIIELLHMRRFRKYYKLGILVDRFLILRAFYGLYCQLQNDGYEDWDEYMSLIDENNLIKDICIQIVAGVNYIHKKGYIHYDLRPENIIVDLLTHRIKIIDFGLTSNFDRFDGSQSYSPPERYKKKISKYYDHWSAGIICVEILTKGYHLLGNNFNALEVENEILNYIENKKPNVLMRIIGQIKKPWEIFFGWMPWYVNSKEFNDFLNKKIKNKPLEFSKWELDLNYLKDLSGEHLCRDFKLRIQKVLKISQASNGNFLIAKTETETLTINEYLKKVLEPKVNEREKNLDDIENLLNCIVTNPVNRFSGSLLTI